MSRQANELLNLQLLDGSANIQEQAEPLSSWLEKNFPNEDKRRRYYDRHLLGEVPDDPTGFGEFYAARRDQLRQRLQGLLAAKTHVDQQAHPTATTEANMLVKEMRLSSPLHANRSRGWVGGSGLAGFARAIRKSR